MEALETRTATARPAGVRAANRATVLQHVRRAQPLSRAEVARRSGLSEGTVSRVVAELLEEHLVIEAGAESTTGGRPGMRLLLDPGHLRAIGVEIQNWETRVGVGSLDGKLLETHSFRTPSDPAETLDLVARECREICRAFTAGQLEGIGVAARGVIDDETGTVRIGSAANWTGVHVREYLEKKLSVPVFVENNVRAAALAEYNAGTPEVQGNRCVLLVCVDEGIGAGLILDGSLYRGRHKAAGELGEMLMADSRRPGSFERLENLGSDPAICERYAELTESGRRPRSGETRGRVRTICHAAMQGDPAARRAIGECCHYLGLGIFNAAAMLDPDVIIVDGMITSAWPLVAESLYKPIADLEPPAIRPGTLGADASLLGSLLLPLETLFTSGSRLAARA